MKKEMKTEETSVAASAAEEEAIELVLFQVSEFYVYLIPPRKSAASYRADEWNVNKWAWEGTLKVISKGEECIICLADKTTGDLYARAFLRDGEPHPVEPVIDSSRWDTYHAFSVGKSVCSCPKRSGSLKILDLTFRSVVWTLVWFM